MSFFQVTQFMREHAIRVLVIGAPTSPELPPLVEDERFAARLIPDRLLQLTLQSASEHDTSIDPRIQARQDMQQGNYEIVVYFPSEFADRFVRVHESLAHGDDSNADRAELQMPDGE